MCERILLQTLDFDLTVEHAYRRAPPPAAPRATTSGRTRPQPGPASTAVDRGPDSIDGRTWPWRAGPSPNINPHSHRTPDPTLRPLLAYVKSIKGTRDLAQVAWSFRVRVGVWVRVRVR